MIRKVFVALVTIIFIFIGYYYFAHKNIALADSYNLAPNHSFEEGINTPIDWTPINELSCTQDQISNSIHAWEHNLARTGSKSLALKGINWTIVPSAKPSWISNYIPLSFPSSAYRIGAYITGQGNNNNLQANLFICLYDSENNNIGLVNTPSSGIFGPKWDFYINNIQTNNGAVAKIRIGIAPVCPFNRPCSGSIWFDDVSVRPQGSDLQIRKFYDLNGNGVRDANDPPLEWRFQLYHHYDCINKNDRFSTFPTTNALLGYTTLTGVSAGEYSVREIPKDGWSNSTPLCQNITVPLKTSVPLVSISFGNIQAPTFPYFSQKDPQWAQNEYDSANTFGPFFCGTTIAGCGCATTSAAMLLKFHGVDKAPNGQPTTPQTLNDWLKANNGYSFGAVKWNSIASYAIKANQNFGTQKIKFNGVGPANDLSLLQNDLTAGKPPILQQPGHFIVATGTQGSTYSIHDPAFQNKTTLAAYNNQFQSSRRFEKTSTDLSALYLTTPAPTEIFLTDSLGRRVGKDPQTGIIYTEIPNSFYFLESAYADQSQADPQLPQEGQGINTLVILTPPKEQFNIQVSGSAENKVDFSAYDRNGDIQNQTLNTNGSNFEVNFSPEPGASFEVFQKVNVDIKPSSDQNPLNLKSNGTLPVAILTTADFNTQNIDPNSVLFGPNKIGEFHQKGHWQDVDSDTDLDLLMHFKISMAGIQPEDHQACLTGKTYDGIDFRGCDVIRLVP